MPSRSFFCYWRVCRCWHLRRPASPFSDTPDSPNADERSSPIYEHPSHGVPGCPRPRRGGTPGKSGAVIGAPTDRNRESSGHTQVRGSEKEEPSGGKRRSSGISSRTLLAAFSTAARGVPLGMNNAHKPEKVPVPKLRGARHARERRAVLKRTPRYLQDVGDLLSREIALLHETTRLLKA